MVTVPTLHTEQNYKLEGFTGGTLAAARAAVQEVRQLCQTINTGLSHGQFANVSVKTRTALADYFGVASDADYQAVKAWILTLNQAVTTAAVTLVYRPNIIVRDPMGRPAQLAGGQPFTGGGVFGYVHTHTVGSGYRVVCGALFISDPTPYYASTTVYHEMSHKVLKTVDVGYGDALCRGYALQGAGVAGWNADNYAYFAIAMA